MTLSLPKSKLGVLLFICCAAFDARAHDPGFSTTKLLLTRDVLQAHSTFARADIEGITPIDTDANGEISPAEISAAMPGLEGLSTQALSASIGKIDHPATKTTITVDHSNNVNFTFSFSRPPPGRLVLECKLFPQLSRGHRQFISLEEGTNLLAQRLLSADQPGIEIDLADFSKPAQVRPSASWGFFGLGLEHILIGYDHLLFLGALLLACSTFRSAACIITCFTLAHSLTLALAAFEMIRMPSMLVEATIAGSIIFVGLENLAGKTNLRVRCLTTLIFGLVHGLGFASVLQEQGIGETSPVLSQLFLFNLGVECGQMAVAAIVFPLLLWLKKKASGLAMIKSGSVLTIAAGIFWLLQRLDLFG